MTEKLPFGELVSDARIVSEIVQQIDRPIPDHAELGHVIKLCSLMMDCWKFDTKARPKVTQCWKKVKWMVSFEILLVMDYF